MEVTHEIQDAKECSEEGATFEVGVIEANDEYSEEDIKNDTTKKWVDCGLAKKDTNVSLILDMEKKSLYTSQRRFRWKTLQVEADSVFPFFSVNCPHCSITLCKVD